MLVIIALLLTACAQPTPQIIEKEVTKVVEVTKEVQVEVEKVVTATPEPMAEGPVRGGSLTTALGVQDTRGFETWQDSTGTETAIWNMLYDSFVRYDDKYEITGGLFESWETEDAQTWVFHVRQGVKWHDGVELKAIDFVEYMDKVLDPEAGATTETIDLFADATYQALDDYTLELVLPRPDAALLDGFTAQWLSRVRDFDPQMPVGTGPFKFVEWERNQHIKMVRNEDYWREGLPYLDELTIAFVPDPSTRIALLLTGEIDVVANVPLPEVGRIAQRDEFQLISTPEQYNAMEYYMLMKNSAPPFDDARVRQAVNYAIDREALLGVTFGFGNLKANPVAAGSWAYNPEAAYPLTRDLEKAKQLMQEAGYEPGQPAFTVSFKYWKEWPENLQIGQIVQANLADIGITVNLELLEIGQWVQTVLHDHEYEMALTALVPRWDPNDQLGNVYRTDDGAALEWENEEFDKYWEGGRMTPNIEERKAAYLKAQEIAALEAPCAVLNAPTVFVGAADYVKGLIRYNRGDIWYERVWLEP
jgi:ABC-type transport system substrate-binding protein